MGQYNFVSPGAAISASLEDLLVRRETQRRQKMLDEITKKNSDSQDEDRQANREIQRANIEAMTGQREALEDERRAGLANRVAGVLQPGQELDTDTEETLKRGGFGALAMPGQDQFAGIVENGEGPMMEQGKSTFRGTAAQLEAQEKKTRLADYIKGLDPNSPEARALNFKHNTGDNAPAGMFEKKAASGMVGEYEYYVDQTKANGGKPMSFEEYQNADANRKKVAAGGEGRGYSIPVQTGQGIVPWDTRNNRWMDEQRRDLKPGETAQVDMTKAQSVLYQVGQIAEHFTPDKVGPLTGRYKTMQLALTGEMGDTGLAEFQSMMSTLQNTVINLRTGAQMSEPEAARILAEVPNFNLPPDVFLSRLGTAKRYFADWMQKRAKFAYGRQTTGDVDKIVGGDIPATVPKSNAPAAAPAAPKSKYKVSVQ